MTPSTELTPSAAEELVPVADRPSTTTQPEPEAEEADGEPQQLRTDELVDRDAVDEDEDSEVYFPPTDPVVIGDSVVGGFSHTSMDSLDVAVSASDEQVGDEALADALREELRADAATSALQISVTVEDRVAYLRGEVAGIEDVASVEEVASRLPQLYDVVEELDVTSFS